MTDLLTEARNFAKERHAGQVRKYTGDPYFNHLHEVAEILSKHFTEKTMIAAAYLHDIIEDTETTLAEIELLFGKIVSGYVDGLTDISIANDGNRKFRKQIDREHLWTQCAEVQLIKCADIISNTKSIVEHDPKFSLVYLEEKTLLLDGMSPVVKSHPLFTLARLSAAIKDNP